MGDDTHDVLITKELRTATIQEPAGPTSFTLGPNTITLEDAVNIVVNGGTGTQFGTADNQKIAFNGATPIVTAILATGTGKTVDNVITALQNLGLLKQS